MKWSIPSRRCQLSAPLPFGGQPIRARAKKWKANSLNVGKIGRCKSRRVGPFWTTGEGNFADALNVGHSVRCLGTRERHLGPLGRCRGGFSPGDTVKSARPG